MNSQAALIQKRKGEFEDFYKGLIPALVEFVDRLGVQPAHEVLNQPVAFAPHLEKALKDIKAEGDEDRIWLLTRVGYFVGEYFAEKYGGSWYVNEIEGSQSVGRYVVGRFAALKNLGSMLDPFEVAKVFVDTPPPRDLQQLLSEVDVELQRADATRT
jgi:hypothetical protein